MKKIVLIIVVLLSSIHSVAQDKDKVSDEDKKRYMYYISYMSVISASINILGTSTYGTFDKVAYAFYKQNYPLIGNKYLPENRFIESKEDLYFGVNFKYYTSINKDNSNSITLEKKQLFPQKGSGYNYFPHNDYLFIGGRTTVLMHTDSYASASVEYEILPLYTLKTNITKYDGKTYSYNEYLPSDIKINLYAKKGFNIPEFYNYEYQINDGNQINEKNWKTISSWKGKETIETSGKDFFGDNLEDLYGKYVYFRVLYYKNYNPLYPLSWSEPLKLTIVPSAPEIIKTELNQPKCVGDNGSITLTFDRKLKGELNQYKANKEIIKNNNPNCSYIGEVMNLSIEDDTNKPALPYQIDINETLLTTNTLTLNNIPFKEGTNRYSIKFTGTYYYKDTAGGCHSITLYTDGANQSYHFSVTMPSALTATATSANITCHGANNGSISFNIAGGTPPYSYSIAKNGAPFSPYTPFSDSSNKITDLATGNYNVHIQDTNGCSVKDQYGNEKVFHFTITEPPALSIKAGTESITHITTPNANDGAYNATLEGGNGNTYTGTLTKINGSYQSQQIAKEFNFKGLSAGDYRFVAADSKGCTTQTTFTIKDYVPMQVTITVTQPISCHSANPDPNDKDENLNGIGDKIENGTLSASVTGGLGNYKYLWHRQEGTELKSLSKDTPTLTDCTEGTYVLSVSDSSNVVTQTVQLKFPEKLNIRVEAPLMQCSQPNSGTAKVIVSGGTPPYPYLWSNGDTTNSISNLTAGKYLITVTDHNGCSTQTQVILKFPDAIEVQPTIQHNRCYGVADGSISLKIAGGKGTISIQWFDSAGKPITEHLSADKKQLTGLTAGTYKVVLSDESDCPTVTELIKVKPAAEIPFSFPDEITLCQGDHYLYTVSDTDFTQCSWVDSTGKEVATGNTFSATLAGVYTLKAIYKGSCQITKQFTVKQKNETFEMDFLAATTSYYDYTLKLIDISKRIDSEQWLLPEGVEMISQQNREAEIRFPKEGVYTIGLQGTLGGCTKRVYKKFWTEKDRIGIGNSDDFHKRISVLVVPNPAGRGTAPYIKVEMTEKSPINVRIFNILGQELFNKDFPAEEHFKILTNSLTLSAGDYIVIVQADKDIIAAKMVIN